MYVPVQNADAGFPIGNKRLSVTGKNPGRKQIEIAAKIEYTGRARPEQQKSEIVGTVLERSQNAALPSVEIAQEI
jgi:hypothetical protein